MGGTQIVAVRQRLTDSLAALDTFSDATVSMTWPVGDKNRDRIFTARATFDQAPASLRNGRTFRDETGTFELILRIEGVGMNQDDTSARAVELGLAAEEFIADNRSTFPGVKWLVVEGPGVLAEMFNDRGALAELTYTVKYQARLE